MVVVVVVVRVLLLYVSDQFWFIVVTKRYKGGVKTPHHQHSVVAV